MHTETRCVVVLSVSTVYTWNTRDHDPPFDNQEQFAFYDLGFPTEAPIIT